MVDVAFHGVPCRVLGRRGQLLGTEALVQLLTVAVEVLLHRLLLLFEWPHHGLVLDLRGAHRVRLLSVPASALVADSELLRDLDLNCRRGGSRRLGLPAETVLLLSERDPR